MTSFKIIIAQILIFFLCSFFYNELSAKPLNASEVIKRTENLLRGNNSYARSRVLIKKKRITREMVFDNWDDQKNEESFIRILSPKKDRGISFLKLKNNLWQYIPKIGREIKIENSLMQDSWMGSDFSNDDLVRESSIVKDYSHVFLQESEKKIYSIMLTAKEGSPVVWNKIIAKIDKSNFLPHTYEYYDHKNRLKKKSIFSDIKKIQGRLFPAKQVMSTIKNERVVSFTAIETIRINFNTKIPRKIFSKANLRK